MLPPAYVVCGICVCVCVYERTFKYMSCDTNMQGIQMDSNNYYKMSILNLEIKVLAFSSLPTYIYKCRHVILTQLIRVLDNITLGTYYLNIQSNWPRVFTPSSP